MKAELIRWGVIECGNECDVIQPYGFVPEDGCTLHDDKKVVDSINRLYGKYCLQKGEVFVGFNTIFRAP